MSLDAGEVKGRLTLDTENLKTNIAASVHMLQAGASAMDASLQGVARGVQSLTAETGSWVAAAAAIANQPVWATHLYSGGLQNAVQATQTLTSATATLGGATASALRPGPAAAAAYTGGLNQATRAAQQLTTQTSTLASTLNNVATIAAGTALGNVFTSAAGAAIHGLHELESGIVSTLEHSVQLAGQFESIGIAMRLMVGNADQAAGLLKDLKTFSDHTPFQFPELAQAAKQLLAMGVNARDVVGDLRMLGDVSSGLSQPIGEVAYQFGQVKSRGEASSIELREFAMRGIPIYSELARVMGVSEAAVRKLTSEGSIGFPQIEAAFRAMTDEGGRFHGMTEEQSRSILGLESTLADAWTSIQVQIGEALVKGADGKNLISDLTAEITKLTPAAVDLGVALADAFKEALPYLKEATEWTTELLKSIDGFNARREIEMGVGESRKNRLEGIPQVQAGIGTLENFAAPTLKGYFQAGFAADDINQRAPERWSQINAGVQDSVVAILHEQAKSNLPEQVKAVLADLRADTKNGPIDPKKWERDVELIVQLDEQTRQYQATIKVAARDFDHKKDSWLNRNSTWISGDKVRELRELSTNADKQLSTLQQQANAALAGIHPVDADADKKANFAKQGAKTAAAETAAAEKERLTAISKGQVSAGGKTAAGAGERSGGGKFDFGAAVDEAKIATLEAAGKKIEAEQQRAKQNFDREIARIDAAAKAGTLTVDQFNRAKIAAAFQFQAQQQVIASKFSDQRQDKAASLARATTDAKAASLEAGEDKEAAAQARTQQSYDEELARIATAQRKMEITEADGQTLRAAAREKFDVETRLNADRQQKTLTEQAAKKEEYETAAKIADMKLRGDLRGAELAEFDAGWKRRIDAITDYEEKASAITAFNVERRLKLQELEDKANNRSADSKRIDPNDPRFAPTSVKQAQDRTKAAVAGSGRKELARLDLRDQLGKLTPEEAARRKLLASRFGRGDDDSNIGSAYANLLQPILSGTSRRTGYGLLSGMPPVRSPIPSSFRTVVAGPSRDMTNVTATVPAIDVHLLAKEAAEALRPQVRTMIEQVGAALRASNYAAGISQSL